MYIEDILEKLDSIKNELGVAMDSEEAGLWFDYVLEARSQLFQLIKEFKDVAKQL